MRLIEHISRNPNLVFVDSTNGKKYVLHEIMINLGDVNTDQKKSLAFLYLDTSLKSIGIYLSFLDANFGLILLSNSLDTQLKLDLEQQYEPTLIYDELRDHIENYKTIEKNSAVFNTKFFINNEYQSDIHENCKILLSTSGTTGSPKLVKLSDKNLLENALSIADYLPINSEDVTPLNLPLHYSYGLSVLHSNAIAGGEIVCGLSDILQRDFWRQLSDFGFTSLAGVPFIYEMLKRIGFLKKNYPSLKYITQAGGNLNQNIKKLFYDYCQGQNIEFYVMYGQTEATARISYVSPDKLQEKITSIGKPIKNGQLSLDEETQELLYSGPNIFGGYAVRKEELTIWENNLLLRTGDLATQDNDGYFYITGRLKRFVKIFGNRVNLDEIETFIKSLSTNSLLACIGVNDEYILIAYTSSNLDPNEFKKKIFDRYKIHPSSVKFQLFKELPLTGNGKIDYKNIKRIHLSN